jgi:hypothetical protein
MSLQELLQSIQTKLEDTHEKGITLEEAEKEAAKCLAAQFEIAKHLKAVDLEARQKKNGLKQIRAAIYKEECKKSDKKPSDTYLEQLINTHELVVGNQERLDEAEVERDDLERSNDNCLNAHIYYRTLSKGAFNG